MAAELGVGSMEVEKAHIVELNTDHTGAKLTSSRRARALAKYIDENDACSACYGSLIPVSYTHLDLAGIWQSF